MIKGDFRENYSEDSYAYTMKRSEKASVGLVYLNLIRLLCVYTLEAQEIIKEGVPHSIS